MKHIFTFLSVLFFINSIIFIQSCNKEEPSQPQNQAPQIQSVSANPSTSSSSRLPAGGIITFLVTATDPERDPLSYTWECSGGSFTDGQNTNTVKWQSPVTQNQASYSVTVNVSDGAQITKMSKTVYVEKATPGINVTPTSLNFSTNFDTLEIKIFNIGTGTLNWQIQNLASWINASPTSGSLAQPTDTATSKIIVTRASLTAGNYNQTINVVNTNNTSNKVSLNISMIVSAYGYVEGYTYYANTTIPVSGVSVHIDNENYTTNSDGYYKLNNITTGNKLLVALKTGYDSYQTNISVVQGRNTKNIDLTSGLYTHNLFGHIKSLDTQLPLQNVRVSVLNDDGSPSNLYTASDFNGYYQVPTVPQGQRFISFAKSGYQTFNTQIFMSNSDYQYDIQLALSTIDCPNVIPHFGKFYNTVIIGNQCWFKENLDVGIMLQANQNSGNNGIIEKYCYDNNQNNCDIYGGLYRWYEAMQYNYIEDGQGICPIGWHIPSWSDYDSLITYVNNDGNALKREDQGSGSGQGTNTSGFAGLLGGNKLFDSFLSLGTSGYHWSSTIGSNVGYNFAYVMILYGSSSTITKYGNINVLNADSYTVRCLKD